MIDSLIPTGRDCDCGHPMVWRGLSARCAVYGSHPAPNIAPVRWRNYDAPFSDLVDELTEMSWGQPALRSPHHKRRRERALAAVA